MNTYYNKVLVEIDGVKTASTFTTSVSAPSLSGTHYGDGTALTGVLHSLPANATFTSSVSAPALSGTHYGDGSNLTGVIHTQYSLPSAVAFVTSVSAPALSGTHYGDGSNLTGIAASGGTADALPLSGGVMTGDIGYLNGSRIGQGKYDTSRGGLSGISLICSIDYDFNWQAGWLRTSNQDRLTPMPLYIDSGSGTSVKVWSGGTIVSGGSGIEISHSGITFPDGSVQTVAASGLSLLGGTLTGGLTGTVGIFTTSLSAPILYGDGTNLTGVIHTAYSPPANATFTSSVSAPALSGTFYGDGSNLTGVVKTQYSLPQASTSVVGGVKVDGDTLAFNGSNQLYYTGAGVGGYSLPTATTGTLGGVMVDGTSITINNGVISASAYNPPANATFTSSVSAPALSGVHYGDGTALTGVIHTQYTPPADATFTSSVSAPSLSGVHYGDGTALTGVIHTQYTPPADATFTSSVSAPALSGVHYGDGSKLTGVQYTPPANATFTSSVSAPALSGTYYGDGSKLLNVISSGGVATDSTKLPLTGGTINGSLTVVGNLTATGTTTFANTTFATTSALSVVNTSPVSGVPALYIGQSGPSDIASFYDIDQGIEVLHVGGINSIYPNVGIKTSAPNKTFTVNGEISASSNISTSGSYYGANATFTTSVSAPSLSGTHYGDGTALTGVLHSLPAVGTFTTSVSAPAVYGTHYGDGSNLLNLPSGSSYTLPTATSSTLGGVKVDGTSISISNGVINTVTSSVTPFVGNLVSDLNLNSSSWTTINWNSGIDSRMSMGTGMFVPGVGGWYNVIITGTFSGVTNSTDVVALVLYKGISTVIASCQDVSSSILNKNKTLTLHAIVYLIQYENITAKYYTTATGQVLKSQGISSGPSMYDASRMEVFRIA